MINIFPLHFPLVLVSQIGLRHSQNNGKALVYLSFCNAVAGVTCSAKCVSTVGALQTSLSAWPGCYNIVLLWNGGAVGVPPGPSPHPTQYYHKKVAETPSQRADSALAVLGDEFRIVGTQGGISQCRLHLLHLNDKTLPLKAATIAEGHW